MNRNGGGAPTARHRRGGFVTIDQIPLVGAGPASSRRGEDRLLLLRLQGAWGAAVGGHLRAVSRPHGLRAGCLVVDVRDAAWKRELERLKPQILPKVAERMPGTPIDDITFRVRSGCAVAPDPIPASLPASRAIRAGEGATRDAAPLPATEDLAELFVPLARIADDELRARVRGVAARYLVRGPSR